LDINGETEYAIATIKIELIVGFIRSAIRSLSEYEYTLWLTTHSIMLLRYSITVKPIATYITPAVIVTNRERTFKIKRTISK